MEPPDRWWISSTTAPVRVGGRWPSSAVAWRRPARMRSSSALVTGPSRWVTGVSPARAIEVPRSTWGGDHGAGPDPTQARQPGPTEGRHDPVELVDVDQGRHRKGDQPGPVGGGRHLVARSLSQDPPVAELSGLAVAPIPHELDHGGRARSRWEAETPVDEPLVETPVAPGPPLVGAGRQGEGIMVETDGVVPIDRAPHRTALIEPPSSNRLHRTAFIEPPSSNSGQGMAPLVDPEPVAGHDDHIRRQ